MKLNRRAELPLLVAVSVLTITAASTVIHDAGSHHTSPLDAWIERGFHRTVQWLSHDVGISTMASVPFTTGSPERIHPVISAINGKAHAVPTTLMASQDIRELKLIGQHLSHTMTPQDWVSAARALTSDNLSQADETLSHLVQQHLSPADIRFVETNFTGSHSFNQADVQLLQQTLQQLSAELTPDEMQALDKKLTMFTSTK